MFLSGQIWVGLVLLGTPVVFFGPLFLTCGLGPMEDDLIQYFPYLAWVSGNLKAGVFPLWNPLAYGGYSAIGDPQSGILYPLNWIGVFLSPGVAYPLLLIIHYWIAGLGMYRLGRQWNLAMVSATTGAVVWMFCGFMLGHRTHYTILAAAAWMSVIFYLWTRIRDTNRPWGCFAAVVVCQGLQLLAGHVQVAVLTGMALFIYLAVTSGPLRVRMLVFLGLSYVLTFGVAAVQLFPVWQVYSESVRSANSYRFITENSFFPLAWPLVIAPASLGLRIPNFLYEHKYFGPWNHCELNAFTTLAGLTLAAFAVRNIRRNEVHRRTTWFLLVLGVLAIFLALGRYNPAFKFLYYLPIVRPFRCPARYLLWFNFAVAGLAMLGMEDLRRRVGAVRFRRFGVWFVVVVGILFAGYLGLMRYVAGRPEAARLVPESMSGLIASVREAVTPWNPAISIPLGVAIGLVIVALLVPRRWLPGMILLLVVVEAGTFAPFYDIRFEKVGKVDLTPPVAKTLNKIAPNARGFIWPLSQDPYVEPLETLEPFCNMLAGRASITGYGPLLNKYARRLFGWELWPTTGQFVELLARTDMLRRYGIRYIVADSLRGRQIGSLKEFAGDGRNDVREVLAKAVTVTPDQPFVRELELGAGMYRLSFQARRTTADQLRLFVSVRGWTDELWGHQQLGLETWDIGESYRQFSWTFFVPRSAGRATQLSLVTQLGQCEFKGVVLSGTSFNLDHLREHPVKSGEGVRLFENLTWRGDGFFAEKVRIIKGDDVADDSRMLAADWVLFSPQRDATWVVPNGTAGLPDQLGTGRVVSVTETVNGVKATVEVERGRGLFVLPAGYNRGWLATVDGLETKVYCADGISRAVAVPEGRHEVTLSYAPNSFTVGLAVTVFAGLILAVILTKGMADKVTR